MKSRIFGEIHGFSAKVMNFRNNPPPRSMPNYIIKSRTQMYIADQVEQCKNPVGMYYVFPTEQGYITRRNVQKKIWDYIFNKYPIDNFPVVMTQPLCNFQHIQLFMDEVFFEQYQVRALYRANPTDLSCYRYIHTNEGTQGSCIIVDSGYSFSHVIPYIKGEKYMNGLVTLKIGGKFLTNYMKDVLARSKSVIVEEAYVVNQIKEDLCYVSLDYNEEEMRSVRSSDISRHYIMPDYHTVSKGFKIHPSKIPVGSDLHIVVLNRERFTVPEVLLRPSIVPGIQYMGLAQSIANCIEKCPEEYKRHMASNIMLTGGNFCFRGMQERLEKDIKMYLPADYDLRVKLADDPINYAWKGGQLLCRDPTFFSLCVTKQQYEEYGSQYTYKKFNRVSEFRDSSATKESSPSFSYSEYWKNAGIDLLQQEGLSNDPTDDLNVFDDDESQGLDMISSEMIDLAAIFDSFQPMEQSGIEQSQSVLDVDQANSAMFDSILPIQQSEIEQLQSLLNDNQPISDIVSTTKSSILNTNVVGTESIPCGSTTLKLESSETITLHPFRPEEFIKIGGNTFPISDVKSAKNENSTNQSSMSTIPVLEFNSEGQLINSTVPCPNTIQNLASTTDNIPWVFPLSSGIENPITTEVWSPGMEKVYIRTTVKNLGPNGNPICQTVVYDPKKRKTNRNKIDPVCYRRNRPTIARPKGIKKSPRKSTLKTKIKVANLIKTRTPRRILPRPQEHGKNVYVVEPGTSTERSVSPPPPENLTIPLRRFRKILPRPEHETKDNTLKNLNARPSSRGKTSRRPIHPNKHTPLASKNQTDPKTSAPIHQTNPSTNENIVTPLRTARRSPTFKTNAHRPHMINSTGLGYYSMYQNVSRRPRILRSGPRRPIRNPNREPLVNFPTTPISQNVTAPNTETASTSQTPTLHTIRLTPSQSNLGTNEVIEIIEIDENPVTLTEDTGDVPHSQSSAIIPPNTKVDIVTLQFSNPDNPQ